MLLAGFNMDPWSIYLFTAGLGSNKSKIEITRSMHCIQKVFRCLHICLLSILKPENFKSRFKVLLMWKGNDLICFVFDFSKKSLNWWLRGLLFLMWRHVLCSFLEDIWYNTMLWLQFYVLLHVPTWNGPKEKILELHTCFIEYIDLD